MKTSKSILTISLVAIGVVSFVLLQAQSTVSEAPPQIAQSFNGHYAEIDTTLAGGAISQSYSLPVLDRAIRMSYSFTFDEGEYSFGEAVVFYATGRNEFVVQGAAGVSEFGLGGLTLVPGSNGAFTFRSDVSLNATVHVGMWY